MSDRWGQMSIGITDEAVEMSIPLNTARSKASITRQINTNLILALHDGIFYPCVILGRATSIIDGYRVYIFHFKEETEIPASNIIGNLKALTNCEVNFMDENGKICTGIVRGTDYRSQDTCQPMHFFLCESNTREFSWVSLPFIHLTREQARVLLC